MFGRISTPPALAGPALSGGEAQDEALGRSQGGFSTKLHLRAEGGGKPIIAVLTGGERHERLRPHRVAGDKGYSSPTARRRLRRRRISPVIPTRRNERSQPTFDRDAYRERNKVERLINRLKQFRRVTTRYEKRANNHLAIVNLAMIMLWL